MELKRCFVVSLVASVSTFFIFLLGAQKENVLDSVNAGISMTNGRYFEPSPRLAFIRSEVNKNLSNSDTLPGNSPQKPSETSYTKITTTPSQRKDQVTPDTTFYICTSFTGGIGNQMFEFATGFGTAFNKKMKMVIGENDLVNKAFELKNNEYLVVSKDKHECRKVRGRGEARGSAYDPNLVNFKADASYNLGLYLQSWKYFNESSEELKKQLVFRQPVPSRAKQVIEGVFKKHNYSSRADVILISIHIRRGDMVGNSYGYQVATKEYIEKAMDQFTNISNKIFVVCSNDMTWSRANVPKDKGVVEFITGNTREVDMAVLASCNHAIMSVGSFSWWSGWLVEGRKIYFKWPAKEGSPLRKQYSNNYMDYFFPNWTGL